jgi:hypothetical protein
MPIERLVVVPAVALFLIVRGQGLRHGRGIVLRLVSGTGVLIGPLLIGHDRSIAGYYRGSREVNMVSSRGGKFGYVTKSRQNVYRALRRKGASKSKAARISNAGVFHVQRSRMAKKGARTRKRHGR